MRSVSVKPQTSATRSGGGNRLRRSNIADACSTRRAMVKTSEPIYLRRNVTVTSRGRKYPLLGRKGPFCIFRESAMNSFLSSSASLCTERATGALEANGETRPTWPRQYARQGETLSGRLINISPSAYSYPLLIKHLLHSSMMHAGDQEIVYRDQKRFTYRTLHERIHRLAGGLASVGVRPGDTVGVLDWDSHRFLEAFFAIPMMGAILQTVNVRLSNEQVLYTIEHAGASTLLVNDEFLELLASIRPR